MREEELRRGRNEFVGDGFMGDGVDFGGVGDFDSAIGEGGGVEVGGFRDGCLNDLVTVATWVDFR